MSRSLRWFPNSLFQNWRMQGWSPKQEVCRSRRDISGVFFEVAKLITIDSLKMPGIVYRKSGDNAESNYTLAAWAQKAKIEARQIPTALVNLEKLKDNLETIRGFTTLNPEEFCSKLQNILADCGVALVFLPHIKGSFLSGASFQDGKKLFWD